MKLNLSWKDIGESYSIANIFFVTSLKEMIFPGMHHYLDPKPHSTVDYLAVFFDVFIVALLFLAMMQIMKLASNAWTKAIFQAIFLISGLFAFGPMSFEMMKWLSPDTERLLVFWLPGIVLSGCLILSIRQSFRFEKVVQNFRLLLLFLLPFSFIIIFETVQQRFFTDSTVFSPVSIQKTGLPNRPLSQNRKVVWIIFDGLDFATLRTAWQHGTNLPDIDRLMDQSFVAQNAHSPNNRTQESIPSLLTGIPILSSAAVAPNDLLLYPADHSDPVRVRESSNIFSELRRSGFRSAIAGWYHPYPRLFQGSVERSFWSPLAFPTCSGISEFGTCTVRFFLLALERVPFVGRLYPSLDDINERFKGESREVQVARNEYLKGVAKELIEDPDIDLVFLHYSIPHFPSIARSDMEGEEDYFTSLEVVNDTLKDLRDNLERMGQWDQTVVIVSSDHFFRFKNIRNYHYLSVEQRQEVLADTRVPFIVKFSGQKSRIDYVPSINTIITKQLILNVFSERIRRPEDFVTWLNELRTTNPDLLDLKNTGRKW